MPWASLSLIGQPMVTSRQWKLAYLLSPLEQHFRGTRKWSRFDQLSCPVPSRPILSSPVQSHPNITQFIPSKPIPPSTLSIKWNISLLLAYRKACCHHLAKSWICMYFKTRLVYLEKFYKTYLRFINSLIHWKWCGWLPSWGQPRWETWKRFSAFEALFVSWKPWC